MKVLISGSSGFIGKPLVESLKREGNEVYRLVRGIATKEDEVSWDIKENKMDVEKLERIQPEVVIHLAGEPLMSPGGWTEAKKKDILCLYFFSFSFFSLTIHKDSRQQSE